MKIEITLDFSSEIKNDYAVLQNIAEAIQHASDTCGIAPEEEESFLERATISNEEDMIEVDMHTGKISTI